MSSIEVIITPPAAVLRVSGEDHLDFLQNQGTAHLPGKAGQVRYSLWLDHKGLIHGDAFVLQLDEDSALLVSYGTPASDLRAKFERHIVADDVEIEEVTNDWKLVSLPAPSAESYLRQRSATLEQGAFIREAEGYLFAGRRLGPGSLESLVPAKMEVPVEMKAISQPEATRIRIEAGIPAIPEDVPPGVLNPLEANIHSALSFDKGCYLGQEVVARVHRLNRLGSRLVRFAGTGPLPELPRILEDKGREVGWITTGTADDGGYLAIGRLKSRYTAGSHAFGDLAVGVTDLPPS
jgi:folate-binding protein YgfZ